uniref:Spermidine synthase n=1 Tax=Strigamia maritima TaxID=126957 RepID=T1JHS3_STRMM
MDALKEGWFSELSSLWPNQCLSLEVDQILHREKSKYQDILVLQTKAYGKVLILDGVIQCTERDEFSYQEMISFLPLNAHPNPRKVLVIGGGDGGVVREVVKHPKVESVVQCEIDERVVEISKEFLPFMAKGFNNPKLQLHIEDGNQFMSRHQNEFDVIITDSSDPIGPAETLFQKSYYEQMKKALRPGGIICSQGECMWYNLSLIQDILNFCRTLFSSAEYAYTTIPTYPGGQIGFIVCSLDPNADVKTPIQTFTLKEKEDMDLRYYNSKIHRAAFILPEFVLKV